MSMSTSLYPRSTGHHHHPVPPRPHPAVPSRSLAPDLCRPAFALTPHVGTRTVTRRSSSPSTPPWIHFVGIAGAGLAPSSRTTKGTGSRDAMTPSTPAPPPSTRRVSPPTPSRHPPPIPSPPGSTSSWPPRPSPSDIPTTWIRTTTTATTTTTTTTTTTAEMIEVEVVVSCSSRPLS